MLHADRGDFSAQPRAVPEFPLCLRPRLWYNRVNDTTLAGEAGLRPMIDTRRTRFEQDDRAVAIYHVVYPDEGFEHAANALFQLVRDAQARWPGKTRHLYLDIDGHRNAHGGFDADMAELQQSFLSQVLIPFLTEVHCPLVHLRNPGLQSDEVPETLIIKQKP